MTETPSVKSKFLRGAALLLAAFALLPPASVQAQGVRPGASQRGLGSAPAQFSGGGLSSPSLAAPLPRPAAAAAVQQQADYIVAVVNTEPITNNEVRQRAERIAQQIEQEGKPLPPREVLLGQVLDRMISDKAQLQLAKEAGIKVDEGAIDQAEQGVAQQNQLTVAELHRRLAADGVPATELRSELRNQITLQRLRERELDPKVKVTDLDVDQFLAAQQNGAAQPTGAAPTEIDLAQVLVAVPENAPAQQVQQLQARAEDVAKRARAGDDFAGLAREFSDGPEKGAGGRMGLRGTDRYPPLFVDAVKGLSVGGVAGPLRSGAGFHVLKVVEKGKLGSPGMTVTQNHARHILLRPSKQLSESAARKQLEEFKRRVESGSADFAALAREFSQDGSASTGGDLGWSSPGQFVPEFEHVLAGLSPGQIAEPLTSRFGVHLIQLLERREATLNPRQQREIARTQLREKKLEEAYGPWAQEVRARAYVDLREPPQ